MMKAACARQAQPNDCAKGNGSACARHAVIDSKQNHDPGQVHRADNYGAAAHLL